MITLDNQVIIVALLVIAGELIIQGVLYFIMTRMRRRIQDLESAVIELIDQTLSVTESLKHVAEMSLSLTDLSISRSNSTESK